MAAFRAARQQQTSQVTWLQRWTDRHGRGFMPVFIYIGQTWAQQPPLRGVGQNGSDASKAGNWLSDVDDLRRVINPGIPMLMPSRSTFPILPPPELDAMLARLRQGADENRGKQCITSAPARAAPHAT